MFNSFSTWFEKKLQSEPEDSQYHSLIEPTDPKALNEP